eukprot:TRINITY_DN78397_c0_g1_i1.p1 TRINITY_DN78397_c0_g1~~TRINITY_DN78397_c0_g1_i1.p1  ORF type:complete len:236 (-),score=67.33 TRINITY_DN78397_c0_g1_i1:40-747(-)
MSGAPPPGQMSASQVSLIRSQLADARAAAEGYQIDYFRIQKQTAQLLHRIAKLHEDCAAKRQHLQRMESKQAVVEELLRELQDIQATYSIDDATMKSWLAKMWLKGKLAEELQQSPRATYAEAGQQRSLLLSASASPAQYTPPLSARLRTTLEAAATAVASHEETIDEVLLVSSDLSPGTQKRQLLQKREELSSQISELQELKLKVRKLEESLVQAYAAAGRDAACECEVEASAG